VECRLAELKHAKQFLRRLIRAKIALIHPKLTQQSYRLKSNPLFLG